jgi:ribosome-binding protein aMBF1 (putative translation factor)
MYEHQDWTPFIIGCKKPPQKTTVQVPRTQATCVTSTTTGKPAWAIEKKIDDPDGRGPVLNRVSQETARLITGGRVSKKMTQEDLARAINVQPAIIKEIEGGKAIENKQLLAKIRQVLGLKSNN